MRGLSTPVLRAPAHPQRSATTTRRGLSIHSPEPLSHALPAVTRCPITAPRACRPSRAVKPPSDRRNPRLPWRSSLLSFNAAPSRSLFILMNLPPASFELANAVVGLKPQGRSPQWHHRRDGSTPAPSVRSVAYSPCHSGPVRIQALSGDTLQPHRVGSMGSLLLLLYHYYSR